MITDFWMAERQLPSLLRLVTPTALRSNHLMPLLTTNALQIKEYIEDPRRMLLI